MAPKSTLITSSHIGHQTCLDGIETKKFLLRALNITISRNHFFPTSIAHYSKTIKKIQLVSSHFFQQPFRQSETFNTLPKEALVLRGGPSKTRAKEKLPHFDSEKRRKKKNGFACSVKTRRKFKILRPFRSCRIVRSTI